MSVKQRLLALAATAATAATILVGSTTAAHADQFTAKQSVTPTLTKVHIVDEDGAFNADDVLDLSGIKLETRTITPFFTSEWDFHYCVDEVIVDGSITVGMSAAGAPTASVFLSLREGNSGCKNVGLGSSKRVFLPILKNASKTGTATIRDSFGDSAQVTVTLKDQVISS